jgi:hypothetical protein
MCPNIPLIRAPLGFLIAACNYADCRECTPLRRARVAALPEPTVRREDFDVSDEAAPTWDAAFDPMRSER